MTAYDYYEPVQKRRYDDRFDSRDYYLKPPRNVELVPRRHDDASDASIEEVRREFPPPRGNKGIRRAHSAEPYYDNHYREHYDDRYYTGGRARRGNNDAKEMARLKRQKMLAALIGAAVAAGSKEAYDRMSSKRDGHPRERNLLGSAALAAGGALAAYQGVELLNKKTRDTKVKSQNRLTYAEKGGNDDEDPTAKKGDASFLENALGVTSLGAFLKKISGESDKKDDTLGKDGKGSKDEKSGGGAAARVQKAAMASLIAGATEAFRIAGEPGGWRGTKTTRVLTAALGAGTIDAAQNHGKGSKLGIAESVIGGLLGNRFFHGSRKGIYEDEEGRSRSRSRSSGDSGGVSGISALAAAGLGAVGAKKLVERSRSRSRSGARHDDYESDDNGRGRGRSRSQSRARSRSQSIVDTGRKALARLGLGNEDYDDDAGKGDQRLSRKYSYDDYDDDYGYGSEAENHRDRHKRGSSTNRSSRHRSRSRDSRYSDADSVYGYSDNEDYKPRKSKEKSSYRR